jgi:hypothetical protein
MAIKYTFIFNSNTLQNLPKFGALVRKYAIWQPWPYSYPEAALITAISFLCSEFQLYKVRFSVVCVCVSKAVAKKSE